MKLKASVVMIWSLLAYTSVTAGHSYSGQQDRPTVRTCAQAWNDSANDSARARLDRTSARRAALRPGSVVSFTSAQRQRRPACILQARTGANTFLIATGVWVDGRVRRWQVSSTPGASGPPTNAVVLSGGRVRLT